jgi:2-(1,2-epoxy-1,2-dihydrophenyl)acetyl-CoA isomerase
MDELVDDENLLVRAIELAAKWGQWAQHSVASTKKLLEMSLHNELETQLVVERNLIIEAGATEDFAEGVESFLAKRQPKFR